LGQYEELQRSALAGFDGPRAGVVRAIIFDSHRLSRWIRLEKQRYTLYDTPKYPDIMETMVQVSKWGNSLAVRLPKTLVDKLGLKEGDELNLVAARNGTLEVETKEDQRKAALERMAARNWTLPRDYKFDRDEANER
jgi:antitoxin MazE